MMRIDVQLTGLQQLRAQLAGVSDRRLAAVAATGLPVLLGVHGLVKKTEKQEP